MIPMFVWIHLQCWAFSGMFPSLNLVRSITEGSMTSQSASLILVLAYHFSVIIAVLLQSALSTYLTWGVSSFPFTCSNGVCILYGEIHFLLSFLFIRMLSEVNLSVAWLGLLIYTLCSNFLLQCNTFYSALRCILHLHLGLPVLGAISSQSLK